MIPVFAVQVGFVFDIRLPGDLVAGAFQPANNELQPVLCDHVLVKTTEIFC